MAELNEKKNEVAKDAAKESKKAPKAEKPAKEKKPSIFARAARFFRECVSEMKKVTWLSRKETTKSTLVVLTVVVALSVLIGVLDTALEFGILGLSYVM